MSSGNVGLSGKEWDTTHGVGGGGGGAGGGSPNLSFGGNGGLYGAGGGGGDGTSPGGDGAQGIIVVTNIPISTGLVWIDAQIYNLFSD